MYTLKELCAMYRKEVDYETIVNNEIEEMWEEFKGDTSMESQLERDRDDLLQMFFYLRRGDYTSIEEVQMATDTFVREQFADILIENRKLPENKKITSGWYKDILARRRKESLKNAGREDLLYVVVNLRYGKAEEVLEGYGTRYTDKDIEGMADTIKSLVQEVINEGLNK